MIDVDVFKLIVFSFVVHRKAGDRMICFGVDTVKQKERRMNGGDHLAG